jgi:hypothetical protein
MFRIVFWDVLPCKWLSTDVSEVRTASIIRDEWSFYTAVLPEDNSEHHTRRHESLKSHIISYHSTYLTPINIISNTKPLLEKPENLNLNNFKLVEASGLKIIASKSPWMASSSYQTSWKSTRRFKIYTHRQTDWWFDKPTFILGSRSRLNAVWASAQETEMSHLDTNVSSQTITTMK